MHKYFTSYFWLDVISVNHREAQAKRRLTTQKRVSEADGQAGHKKSSRNFTWSKSRPTDQNGEEGFITMIVILVAILVAAIFFAYMRVKSNQQ